MRVLGWRGTFYQSNIKSRNNKCYHLLNIYSVPQANYLLSNLICAGLHEKTDHLHVTNEEEEIWRELVIQAFNHCVTLPPAEHLLSARLLGHNGFKTFQGAYTLDR